MLTLIQGIIMEIVNCVQIISPQKTPKVFFNAEKLIIISLLLSPLLYIITPSPNSGHSPTEGICLHSSKCRPILGLSSHESLPLSHPSWSLQWSVLPSLHLSLLFSFQLPRFGSLLPLTGNIIESLILFPPSI